ncbi:hypothetical protein ACRTEU_23150 [Vibrio alginolyticus]|uniref:hypothetical protein n=1 Tax=Vibrio alginolyticus TaxID=663 RepID=UPI001D2BC5A9|nr:hypothetical protein [Vibrio alginolyticus]EGQ8448999.1 hypothetical protein [Vibrio alginolyticus]EGQ9717172.1 hypothetical protein [Vibrio alginolyticus]EGR2552843.1 hypothetical protein [Vibrio alginolyticus]EJV5952204.1 hypothetical protein [Vibrio alginolyticus]MCR9958470.1 hypothetical protein [Vibrio alginolyticus]
MVNELVIATNAVATMYFMGDKLAQHDKAQEIAQSLDSGFLSFLKLVKDQKPLELIKFVLKFFGAVALAGFVGFLLLGMFKIQSAILVNVFSVAIVVATVLSGSLVWVIHHKEVIKYFMGAILLFGGVSLLMPLMDIFGGGNMTHVFATMMSSTLAPIIDYVPEAGTYNEAIYVASVYAGFFVFMYITSWLYAAPTAIFTCSLVALPIWLARLIDKAFPKQPVVIVFLVLWLYSFIYMAYA